MLATAAPLTLRDDLGRTVTLARPPARRIVSLMPSITENLFAIGAGPLIVGVTTACDFPPEAARLPKIGDARQYSAERIRALRPDMAIIESGTIDRASADNLQTRLKTALFAFSTDNFDDVPRLLQTLGRITGRSANTQRVIAAMRAKANQAGRLAGKGPRPRVFVEIGRSPLYSAGPGSFIDDLIRRAGGENVVTGTNPFPQYAKE